MIGNFSKHLELPGLLNGYNKNPEMNKVLATLTLYLPPKLFLINIDETERPK